jgi:hypothetical protein
MMGQVFEFGNKPWPAGKRCCRSTCHSTSPHRPVCARRLVERWRAAVDGAPAAFVEDQQTSANPGGQPVRDQRITVPSARGRCSRIRRRLWVEVVMGGRDGRKCASYVLLPR